MWDSNPEPGRLVFCKKTNCLSGKYNSLSMLVQQLLTGAETPVFFIAIGMSMQYTVA